LSGPFLDLFAGSGAGGIAALGWGAPSATFVERNNAAARVIDENLHRNHIRDATHDGAQVVRADVVEYLRNSRPAGDRFTAVLIDPPYGDPVLQLALETLGTAAQKWLAPGAFVVAKHFWRDQLPERVGGLRRVRDKRFGETALTFYTRAEEEGA
jgi:16S rRNA (guanine(966)-N(2))-methyltransferase RsmD